ncbi:MAG: hypothetical protein ACUZ8I_12555 [Candidatus Scalindua sp.]
MNKNRMQEAAKQQVAGTVREVSEEHQERKGKKRSKREERLVIRLSKDELRRITRYCEDRTLPVSTGVRSLVLEHIRKA